MSAKAVAYQNQSNNLQDVSHLVSVVLVIRDWSQSNFLNMIPLNHKTLLERFYPAISAFNGQGAFQMSAVETSSGAQPQMEILNLKQNCFDNMEEVHNSLPPEIPFRLLIRGPFVVGVKASSPEDIEFQLREMAEASGGLNGREVIFKLFEAQNDPKEHADSLKIIEKLKSEGYNVSVELAECYTAQNVYSLNHYGDVADALILNALEHAPESLKAIGLKDMIGGMKGAESATSDWDNAGDLVDRFIGKLEAQSKHKGFDPKERFTLAIHCHDTGFSTEANIEAAIIAINKGYKIRLDIIPDGEGFSNVIDFVEGLKDRGYDCGLSKDQVQTLKEMEVAQNQLSQKYAVVKTDITLISPDRAREVNLPGGAVPTFIKDAVLPLQKIFNEAAANDPEFEIPELKEIADMATQEYYNLWKKLTPHGVTPGARNLGLLAFHVLKNRHEGKEDFFNLSDTQIEYWRGEMPFDIDPDLLKEVCTQHLEKTLPTMLGEDEFENIRNEIINTPTDKEKVRGILDAHEGLDEAQVEAIVEQVGKRTLPLSHGKPVLHNDVREKVENMAKDSKIELTEKQIKRYTAIGLIMGGDITCVKEIFEIQHDLKKHHVPNPEGLTPEQWALEQVGKTKEELAAEALAERMKELTSNPDLAMELLGGGTDYISHDVVKPVPQAV